MAERVQLTHQAIRMTQDWESLPKNERESVAREIAAAARYWRIHAAHGTDQGREAFQRCMPAAVTPRGLTPPRRGGLLGPDAVRTVSSAAAATHYYVQIT